jgi:hypothetical protein
VKIKVTQYRTYLARYTNHPTDFSIYTIAGPTPETRAAFETTIPKAGSFVKWLTDWTDVYE